MPTFSKICGENLFKLASAYAKARGVTIGTVSKFVYGNSKFLTDFKNGKQSVSIQKFDEMVKKLALNWPKGTHWPLTRAALIERPKNSTAR